MNVKSIASKVSKVSWGKPSAALLGSKLKIKFIGRILKNECHCATQLYTFIFENTEYCRKNTPHDLVVQRHHLFSCHWSNFLVIEKNLHVQLSKLGRSSHTRLVHPCPISIKGDEFPERISPWQLDGFIKISNVIRWINDEQNEVQLKAVITIEILIFPLPRPQCHPLMRRQSAHSTDQNGTHPEAPESHIIRDLDHENYMKSTLPAPGKADGFKWINNAHFRKWNASIKKNTSSINPPTIFTFCWICVSSA